MVEVLMMSKDLNEDRSNEAMFQISGCGVFNSFRLELSSEGLFVVWFRNRTPFVKKLSSSKIGEVAN